MVGTKPSEQLIAELFDAQPEAVVWTKPVWSSDAEPPQVTDFEIGYCNQSAVGLLKAPKEKIIGARMLHGNLLDADANQLLFGQMSRVLQTGEHLEHTYYNQHLDKYFSVLRSKVMEGVLSVTRDRTEQVLIEIERQRQNNLLNSILDASLNAVFALEAVCDSAGTITDFTFTRVNPTFARMLGRPAAEIEGSSFLALYPTAPQIGLFDLNCQVIETGASLRREVYYNGDGMDAWFDVSMVKLGEKGLVVTFNDITEQKRDKQAIEDAARQLQNIIDSIQSSVSIFSPVLDEKGEVIDFCCRLMNRTAETFFKKGSGKTPDTPLSQFYPEYKADGTFDRFRHTFETGEPQRLETHFSCNGTAAWYDALYTRLGNDLLVTLNDITPIKMLQLELEATIEELRSSNESLAEYQQAIELTAQQLHAIINTSQSGIHTLVPMIDGKGMITDFRFGLVNPAVAQYVGRRAEDLVGELVSISFPDYKRSGLFDTYVDIYHHHTTKRFDFHCNNEGEDIYLDILCTRLGNEVLVTFADFTSFKKLQLTLEEKVEALKRSNASLEEFAYAASHDLQEPLRKINYFADRLKSRTPLDPEALGMHERMEKAVQRMRTLIEDLLAYSQAGSKTGELQVVALNETVGEVITDLETAIQEKNAVIHQEDLPVVNGDKLQLRQLFQNLISNALKYSKKEVAPLVEVRSRQIQGAQSGLSLPAEHMNRLYHLIEVSDNGIGFDQADAERIFNIFQRLHGNKEYSGTGVGLSIARKVVENHQGFIGAQSQAGAGATFSVLLPV